MVANRHPFNPYYGTPTSDVGRSLQTTGPNPQDETIGTKDACCSIRLPEYLLKIRGIVGLDQRLRIGAAAWIRRFRSRRQAGPDHLRIDECVSVPNPCNRTVSRTHNQILAMEWTTPPAARSPARRSGGASPGRWCSHSRAGYDHARNVFLRASIRFVDRSGGASEHKTSYRQKNHEQAGRTSRDPVNRLLLEGLGYLFRQVWVRLEEELARRSRTSPNV